DMGEPARGAALLAQALAAGGGHRMLNALSLMRTPGAAPADDCGTGEAPLWIDVTDALAYLMHSRAVSGIQRVIVELMQHALANPEAAQCVITRPWDGGVWSLSRRAQAEFLALAQAGEGGGGRAASIIGQLFHSARAMELREGARLFRPGGFWSGGGNPPLHAALREAGMVNIGLIYDLIPLQHPQFCVSDLVRDMAVTVAEEIAATDLLLAISEFSAASLREHAHALGIAAPDVIAVPLARERIAANPAASQVLADLQGRRFVLCPGTVESRKNQALLIRVWQALLDEGLSMPMLVIAGKQGWRTQEYDQALAECPGARALLLRLESLSDADMAALYDACLFTTFPSFAEGWGLPVGESLAHGKACIASNRCSIPEAGGAFAEYIDPDDIPGATAAFRRLLADDALRAMLEARIAAEFRPRSWAEAAGEMMARATAAQPRAQRGFAGPLLAPGTDWRPLPTNMQSGADELALRLMLGIGWTKPGRDGTKPADESAPLCLLTEVPGRLTLWLGEEPQAESRMLPAGTHRIMLGHPLSRVQFTAAP
ncbi:MAG: glycosyltransferase family 1 protein, partial [Alphaproteobacteria bacterium]|nr:glycosyltransferase family 1 protein [Alphaproteobacteria bacterium]